MTTPSPTCFSPISTIRCQDFTRLQYIELYIPIGVQVLMLPVLLIVIWRIPKLTLFLLAIEVLLNVSIISWDLIIKLINPIDLTTFKVEDTILAIISPIPNLFLHLTLTSYILDSPLRHSLSSPPTSSRSRIRTIIVLCAGCLIASLIPISLISSILPSLIPLEYGRMKDGIIKISFVMLSDTGTFKLLVDIGVFTGIAYILIIGILIISSSTSTTAVSRTLKKEKMFRYLVVVGLILASIEIGLSISKNQRFILVLVRRVVHLVSRICLVSGLTQFYRTRYLSHTTSEGITDIRHIASDKQKDENRNKKKGRGRDTITTFGTPPSALLSTFDHPLPRSQPQRIPPKATRRKPSTRKPGSKLEIGNPILGSFKKNTYKYDPSSELGMNKDFYDLGLGSGVGAGGNDMKFGIGMIGSQLAGTGMGSPRVGGFGSGPDIGRKDNEKVRLKIQNKTRAPILSFTPSTFTQSSLDALASNIPRFPMPHPHPHPLQHGYNVMNESDPTSPYNSSSATTKKNVGSIYSPDRISVDQSDLSIWPPVIMIDRSNGHYSYRPRLHSTITDRRNESGNVVPINDYSYSNSNFIPNFTRQNYTDNQMNGSSGQRGEDGIKRRTRSGTDTERGIWFTSSLNPNNSTSSITNPDHSILEYGSSSLRPTLGYRKSTDPTEAIYPSPTASSTLEGSSTPLEQTSGIVKKERTGEARNDRRNDEYHPQQQQQQQRQSLNSSYSQTIHSTQSISNSTIKDLFYSTPIQSPSSPLTDTDSSPNSKSNSSLGRSYRTLIPSKNTRPDENPFNVSSSSSYSDKNEVGTKREMKKNTNTRDDVDHNHILRKSELQNVLKSLNQLRRETGFSGTFELDVDTESNVDNWDSSVYSPEDIKKPWTTKEVRISHNGSFNTFNSDTGFTVDSEISNDDLTPVAEITLINGGRRNFGGVI